MPARAILLDALGTLLYIDSPLERLLALLSERHGIDVAPERAARALRAEMGHYRSACIAASDEQALAALRLECAAILARELDTELAPAELLPTLLDSLRFVAFPEVEATLGRWRAQGLRLVVASNWDVSLHAALAQAGVAALLDGAVTSAEVGAAKPAHAVFEAALELAGVGAAEAIHVGDSLVEDVDGARAAGIAAVWLRRDGAPVDGTPPPEVPVIASLDQLEPES